MPCHRRQKRARVLALYTRLYRDFIVQFYEAYAGGEVGIDSLRQRPLLRVSLLSVSAKVQLVLPSPLPACRMSHLILNCDISVVFYIRRKCVKNKSKVLTGHNIYLFQLSNLFFAHFPAVQKATEVFWKLTLGDLLRICAVQSNLVLSCHFDSIYPAAKSRLTLLAPRF